jgi:hypothetical protein
MTPKRKAKTDHGDELLAARVVREREWAYGGWLAHKSWTQLRIEANRPTEQGGLGYDLSIQALKGLVDQERAARGELRMDRDAHIERELHDLDVVQQIAAAELRRAAEAGWMHDKALGRYVDIGRERRKLLGLDAAQKIEAEVTHRDAVTDELNAMLGRLDLPPIKETQP